MAKFVEVHTTQGKQAYVNIDLVRIVGTDYPTAGTTSLIFGEGHTLVVIESPTDLFDLISR